MSQKIYDMITNQIIEKLENGTVPWRKPWNGGIAMNWKTQKPYRGINTFLLDGGEYATFKQITQAGGHVKKGSKSHTVVFWKMLEVEDEENEGETKNVPMLRYYRVFKVGEQTEGIEPKQNFETYHHDPIEEAEAVIRSYTDAPTITHQSGGAWYKPLADQVNVPPMEHFPDQNKFYSTCFHELTHSTGHQKRLARKEVMQGNKFGSQDYSKEELVAELGAAMLCGVTGIENTNIDNSAAYIQSWLKQLRNDNTLIVSAAQRAQKAIDYIQSEYQEKKQAS